MLNAFERAESAYSARNENRRAARMALELSIEHYFRQNEAVFTGWFARAMRLLDGDEQCLEHGLARWGVGRIAFEQGDLGAAREIFEETMALATRLREPELEALSRQGLGHVHLSEGRRREGMALIDEANALAVSGAVPLWATGNIYCSTIWACRNLGDWRRAREWTETSLRWCERVSVRGFPGLCRFHRAEILRFHGALDDAERDALDAIDELLAANPRDAPWAYSELGEIRRRRGDLDGAATAFGRALELSYDPEPGLALLHLDRGDIASARRAIDGALAADGGLYRQGQGFIYPAAVTIALAADDLGAASSALRALDEVAAATDSVAFRAAAATARAEVALAEDDAEAAIASLRIALRDWAETDAPYEAANARLLLALALRAAGDEPTARLELDAARAAAERLGAQGLVQRASTLSGEHALGRRAARTFMFTDIVDSTKFVDLLGDDQWDELLAWHDRTMRAAFAEHSGTEIKNEGDGFFVAFDDPGDALRSACAIQRGLAQHRRDHGFAPSVRIGLHTAEAIDRGTDYAGRAVHATARIAAAGRGGEIVASCDALAAAGDGFDVDERRSLELKGFAVPIDVVTVRWTS